MSWMTAIHLGEIERLHRSLRLKKLEVEIYRPTVLVPIYTDRGLVQRPEPLYFNYLFIRDTGGVDPEALPAMVPLRWVTFGGRIAILSEQQIDMIKSSTERASVEIRRHVKSADFGDINRGKYVEIVGGAFGGTYGKILSAGPRGSVVLEITFVGRPTRCTVRVNEIRLVDRQIA
ncbi:MAG: hypothetical protein WBP42_02455 [Candidatus Zixiibacteriota bacterium]